MTTFKSHIQDIARNNTVEIALVDLVPLVDRIVALEIELREQRRNCAEGGFKEIVQKTESE